MEDSGGEIDESCLIETPRDRGESAETRGYAPSRFEPVPDSVSNAVQDGRTMVLCVLSEPQCMTDTVEDSDDLPSVAGDLADQHPEIWEHYSGLGKACSEAGPIDDETTRLVKLALAAGSQSEGAVHSHVRRGLEEGIDPEKLEHVALLSIPTVGFPKAMATRTWIEDVVDDA